MPFGLYTDRGRPSESDALPTRGELIQTIRELHDIATDLDGLDGNQQQPPPPPLPRDLTSASHTQLTTLSRQLKTRVQQQERLLRLPNNNSHLSREHNPLAAAAEPLPAPAPPPSYNQSETQQAAKTASLIPLEKIYKQLLSLSEKNPSSTDLTKIIATLLAIHKHTEGLPDGTSEKDIFTQRNIQLVTLEQSQQLLGAIRIKKSRVFLLRDLYPEYFSQMTDTGSVDTRTFTIKGSMFVGLRCSTPPFRFSGPKSLVNEANSAEGCLKQLAEAINKAIATFKLEPTNQIRCTRR